MAKFYSAWGDEPYMVKKGGERIFRHFIQHISPEEESGFNPPEIDRTYYEDIISKIINVAEISEDRKKAATRLFAMRIEEFDTRESIMTIDESSDYDFEIIDKDNIEYILID